MVLFWPFRLRAISVRNCDATADLLEILAEALYEIWKSSEHIDLSVKVWGSSLQSNLAKLLWTNGYSIGELWGNSLPVARGGPPRNNEHLIMWGILAIIDDQVSQGAGHQYLRERLWHGQWIAVGFLDGQLALLPRIEDAKFGRKPSPVGDGTVNYTDVRVVHAHTAQSLNVSDADGDSQSRLISQP